MTCLSGISQLLSAIGSRRADTAKTLTGDLEQNIDKFAKKRRKSCGNGSSLDLMSE